MISERERQGALLLAAAMRRCGKSEREIASAIVRANEFGVLSAMVDTIAADDAPVQSVAELSRDYVYRDERRADPQEAREQQILLDRQWGYSPEAQELKAKAVSNARKYQARQRAQQNGAAEHNGAERNGTEPPVVDQEQDPVRCRRCKYLVGSVGHQVKCG